MPSGLARSCDRLRIRKAAKALFVVIVSLVSAIALSAASAFFAALAFGAVALIVPGTGTPKPADVHNYLENARNYYLGDTACGTVGACQDGDLQGIPYPASFWPLSIFPSWCRSGPDGCDKWDDSVGQGAAALTASLKAALNDESDPNQQVVIFGYSQGGAVVSKVLHDYGLTEEEGQDPGRHHRRHRESRRWPLAAPGVQAVHPHPRHQLQSADARR